MFQYSLIKKKKKKDGDFPGGPVVKQGMQVRSLAGVLLFVVVQSLSRVQLLLRLHGLNPPDSSIHGFSRQEGVVISFSRGSFQPRDQTSISCIGKWILSH